MKRNYTVIILLALLLLWSETSFSQEKITKYQGLRVGTDLAEVFINGSGGGKFALMISFDYEFKENYFAVLELGSNILENLSDSTSNKINGFYGLLGLDLNALKDNINDDILHYGIRYGYSPFSHNIDLAEEYSGNFNDIGKETFSAHWAEAVAGAKTELWFLKNVFIGLSVRAKFLISKTKEKSIVPKIVPGYGDASKGANFDFNWTLAYRIPFKKITREVAKENKKKKK